MPPELRHRWEELLIGLQPEQINSNFDKSASAAAEQSFSGFVRRSVHRRRKPLTLLASETTIDPQRLAHFMRGEGELSAAEVGRLLQAVDVELVETASDEK